MLFLNHSTFKWKPFLVKIHVGIHTRLSDVTRNNKTDNFLSITHIPLLPNNWLIMAPVNDNGKKMSVYTQHNRLPSQCSSPELRTFSAFVWHVKKDFNTHISFFSFHTLHRSQSETCKM